MTSFLPAWRQTYATILRENGVASEPMRTTAFALACHRHSLTLEELVAERRTLRISASDVFAPFIMATLSDWGGTLDDIQRLLAIEDQSLDKLFKSGGYSLERILVSYAQNNQPLPQDVHDLFHPWVETWVHQEHRIAWYRCQTSEQSQKTVLDTLNSNKGRSRHYFDKNQKDAMAYSLQNIPPQAPVAFWKKVLPDLVEVFRCTEEKGRDVLKCLLQQVPASEQDYFVGIALKHWETNHRNLNPDYFGDWIVNVMEHQPRFTNFVLERIAKNHAHVFESTPLRSNGQAIDYFLEHGIKTSSGSANTRKVLDAMVHGNGGDTLRERAWVKKLAMIGAKPSDAKKMESWTPAMHDAFNYWLASSFMKYAAHGPETVHTHINREMALEYQHRFNIDLRNPAQFQRWREQLSAKGPDPFAAYAVNDSLCDGWEQGCHLYVASTLHGPHFIEESGHDLFEHLQDEPSATS